MILCRLNRQISNECDIFSDYVLSTFIVKDSGFSPHLWTSEPVMTIPELLFNIDRLKSSKMSRKYRFFWNFSGKLIKKVTKVSKLLCKRNIYVYTNIYIYNLIDHNNFIICYNLSPKRYMTLRPNGIRPFT